MTASYTTPEGYVLPRPLLLPDVRDFAELLECLAPWDYDTMNHRSGVPGPARPEPVGCEGNELGPFCSVDLGALGRSSRHLAVRARPATVAALRGHLFSGDVLSFRVIGHVSSGRALVLAQHQSILADHWLAYIDPATIPHSELVA